MENAIIAVAVNILIAIIVVVSTQFILKRMTTKTENGELLDNFDNVRIFDLALTCSEYEQTSGGRLKSYFDTDQALLRDPDVLNEVSNFIANILKDYPNEKICFVEKDSGPIGSLLMSGLISSLIKKPMSVIRTRKDVHSMSLKGDKITSGDKIVLIQDVVTTGFQIVLAAKTIERLGGRIVAVISVLDREMEKLEDFTQMDVKSYSFCKLSSAPTRDSCATLAC